MADGAVAEMAGKSSTSVAPEGHLQSDYVHSPHWLSPLGSEWKL